MKTLSQRVRALSTGYRCMDDQAELARDVAELEKKFEWYQSGDIHTCHGKCKRPICVLRRKSNWQAEMLQRAKEIMRTSGEYGRWLFDLERGPEGGIKLFSFTQPRVIMWFVRCKPCGWRSESYRSPGEAVYFHCPQCMSDNILKESLEEVV